jgi:hypothetical protein
LAFTDLPRLESTDDVYRLYLAEALLDDGFPLREILTALGLDRTMRQIAGKVTKLGPSIDVGVIEPEKLTDELIVPLGGLKVAIRLPEDLQSADQLKFDFVDGSFVVVGK